MKMRDGTMFGTGALAGFAIASLMWMLILLSMLGTPQETSEAYFSLSNSTGDDLNLTVFVLNGDGWDEMPVFIANNTTQSLVVAWHGTGEVQVHIVYDDCMGNERVMRYIVENGKNQMVLLIP